ncbi:MAG: tetratricopeptide repeat-containing glycosyltransferase family protein [Tepidisphaeraceae bacterium]|jgi:tetratricopeptide (TPR) repeat protein
MTSSNRNQLQISLESAVALQRAGKLPEAEAIYRRVLAAVPRHPDALFLLGLILNATKRFAEAAEVFHRAIEVNPGAAKYYANLAVAVGAPGLGRIDEAIEIYRKALELQPAEAALWSNLGNELRAAGRWQEAIDCYRRAVQLKPDFADAYCNLGVSLQEVALQNAGSQGNNALAEVIASYQKAVALDGNFALAHWNLGSALLLSGDYERGLEEYEWRWRCQSFSQNVRLDPKRQWACPEGVGNADVTGRTILVYSEQGLGDSIQFARYLPMLAARGARVWLQCPASLQTLLGRCQGVERAMAPGEDIPPYDWHVPMLSLPFAFGTRVATIPASIPYVKADAGQIEFWRQRLDAAAGGFPRVGLAWSGNPKNRMRYRSIRFDEFAAPLPTAIRERVRFVSLQKGEAAIQAASPPAGFKLLDFTDELRSFDDTAGLIANLDLVISVDTAVAHLAGAMGKPTWVLLPVMCEWRWMLNHLDSPWYPTMRLFRQPSGGQWGPTVESIVAALEEHVSRGR